MMGLDDEEEEVEWEDEKEVVDVDVGGKKGEVTGEGSGKVVDKGKRKVGGKV